MPSLDANLRNYHPTHEHILLGVILLEKIFCIRHLYENMVTLRLVLENHWNEKQFIKIKFSHTYLWLEKRFQHLFKDANYQIQYLHSIVITSVSQYGSWQWVFTFGKFASSLSRVITLTYLYNVPLKLICCLNSSLYLKKFEFFS